jgi:hypothetical protein
MMLGVAQQLFKQFSDRARSQLELAEAAAAPVIGAQPASVAAPVGGEPAAAPVEGEPAETALVPPPPALPPAEPVSALSLLFNAFWAWLRRLFGKKDG